jgi:hypothetical protein
VDDFIRSTVEVTPEWALISRRRNEIRAASGGQGMGLLDREVIRELREIQKVIDTRRRIRPSTARTDSEKELVLLLAQRRLRMQEHFTDISRDIRELLPSDAFDFLLLARSGARMHSTAEHRFLQANRGVDPIFTPEGPRVVSEVEYQNALRLSQSPLSERAIGARLGQNARDARTWFNRLDQCVRSSPRQEQTDRRRFFFLTDLGQSLGITSLGFIAGAGEKEVDWAYLPVDLMLTVFDKLISQRISFRDSPLRVRFLYATFYNEARVAVDLGIYMVWPRDEEELNSAQRLNNAMTRTEWGTLWNAMTTWTSVGLSTILGGLECFSPTPQTRAFISTVRLGNSLSRSYFFYHGRQEYMDWREAGD